LSKPKSSADGVSWNFEGLYTSLDDPRIKSDLDSLDGRAKTFEGQYRSLMESGITPAQMREALDELEALNRDVMKVLYYARLNFAKNTTSHKEGALMQMAEERYSKLTSQILFFDLAWCKVDDDAAEAIMSALDVAKYRHYLEVTRLRKPHKLTEPEEKVWEALSLTSRKAFVRLFDETMGRMVIRVEIDGEVQELTLDAAIVLLRNPDREVRKNAWLGITRALDANTPLLTFIFNNLVQHHAITDEFRKYPHPARARNLDNEVDDETVQSLLDAVDRNVGLVARYYNLKQRILGYDSLKDYDRYAPIFAEVSDCTYEEAKSMTLDAYSSFSPRAGEIALKFFDNGWIDAELKQGKEGGAFSANVSSDHHPYILLNFTDSLDDAMTMAHEMGHGIHQYLAMSQGDLQMNTPLVTAETASVFGEMLLFNKIVTKEVDPKKRLALLCEKIEDIFATAFRQVMMNRFETRLHKARRETGELPPEEIHRIWKEENVWMFGDSVEMTDEYSKWWMYVLHFVHYPFYTYAYSFGELMVLALYEQYRKSGGDFVDKYMDMLGAGGSDYPRNLMANMGMDITDPQFWQLGLDLVERMIAQAEEEAATLGL
jgi:oligoendopeptidase F